MNFWGQLISNRILDVVFLAWFIAQAAKVVIVLLTTRKIDFKRFIEAGGMPSSHSSTVVALATCIAKYTGFGSIEFALAFVFAIIVMYDAAGVRRAAGKQAQILNKLIEDWEHLDDAYREVKLKELLGHTPVEVFVGAALGFALAMTLY